MPATHCQTHNLIPFNDPKEMTYEGSGTKSTINYIMANVYSAIGSRAITTVAPENTSPHHLVSITLHLNQPKTIEDKAITNSNKLPMQIYWKQVDKDQYANTTEEQLQLHTRTFNELKNGEEQVKLLNNILFESANACTPTPPNKNRKKQPRRICTPAIQTAIHHSRKAHWKWKMTDKDDPDLPEIEATRIQMNKTLRKLQRQTAAQKREESLQLIMEASPRDQKLLNRLLREQRQKTSEPDLWPQGNPFCIMSRGMVTLLYQPGHPRYQHPPQQWLCLINDKRSKFVETSETTSLKWPPPQSKKILPHSNRASQRIMQVLQLNISTRKAPNSPLSSVTYWTPSSRTVRYPPASRLVS